MVDVRKMELRDIGAIEKLYRSSKPAMGRDFRSYPFTEWVVNNERVLLVAEAGKKIIGFIVVRPKGDEASIDLFCYDKKSKADSLKDDLLNAAEEALETKRITAYVPKADKLVSVFKKRGYEVYDEIKELFGKGNHAYLLIKHAEKGPKKHRLATAKRAPEEDPLKGNLERLDAYLDF